MTWSTQARTSGGSRLYGLGDIDRLNPVRELLVDGLDLAGIARVIALEDRIQVLEEQLRSHGRSRSAD